MRLAAILFGITVVLVIIVTVLVGCAWALARWLIEDEQDDARRNGA